MTSIQVNYGDVEPAAKVVEYGLPTLYHADNENVLTGNHSTTSGSLHEIGLPTKPSSDTGKLLSDNNGLPTKRASDDTIYDTREVINHAETSYSKLSNNSMIISAVLLLIAAIAIVIAVVFTTDNSFSIKLNEETNTDAQKGKSCEDGACKNGARCIPANATQKDITCLCSPGFSGVYCDQDVDECASSPCSANAMCKDGSNGYTCVCLPGYTGQSCQTEIDECVNDPCKNQGTCEDKLNRYNCICANGYTGMDCSTDIDECSSAPCQNDGTCLDLVSMYSCKCPNGFNGSDCEIGINECESSPCMNDATCKDGILHYNCICMMGYTGTHCETEIDECLPDPCQYNGTCNDYIGFYNCTCPKGYEGQNCQIDIDECSSAPCLNDGTCLDLVSMYSCKCPNGFNGSDCENDINECESSPCMNDATCKDGILHYNCICMTGYTGTHCETEIDECLPDPCQYNGTCNDYIGFYNCTCPKGYGGQNCQIEGPCLKSPCKNGGRCVETEDWRNYYCQCPHCTCDTTIGVLPDCELDLLFCFKNNISSTKLKHPYECDKYVECTDMFYLYENQCATSLTLDNNGNCVSKAAMASCNMTVIDVSKSKVTANQTCADYECFNGGTCVDPPGKPPTCTCPIDCACGDMGDHCQWKDEFSCLGRLDGTYTNIRNCSTIIHCQNQRADLTADPCPAGTAYDSENKVCQLIEKLPCATKP